MASTKITTPPLNLSRLVPGDWLRITYGYDRITVYVVENTGYSIIFNKRHWPVSSGGIEEKYSDSTWKDEGGSPIYLGRTKKRWWWKILPWRDVVCPYPKPKRSKR